MDNLNNKIENLEKNEDDKIEVTRRNLQQIMKIIKNIGDDQSRQSIKQYFCKFIFRLSKTKDVLKNKFMNFLFLGDAGIGKTKTASDILQIFSRLHILANSELGMKVVSSTDLTSGFVGNTASKTQNLLYGNLESIIFLDEAYSLVGCTANGELDNSQSNYGQEAIDIIVQFLTEWKGSLIFIAAGYEKHMENCFLGTNPGLPRRFPIKNRFLLENFTNETLFNIFANDVNKKMPENNQIFFDDNKLESNAVNYYILEKIKKIEFKNQASDMITLSNTFIDIYYSITSDKKFSELSFPEKIYIIDQTFIASGFAQ